MILPENINSFFENPSYVGFFCQLFPWILIILWLFYSILICSFSYKLRKLTNYYLFVSIPNVFITLGLLGTFLGITYGLIHFDTSPEAIKQSIRDLLLGLKNAFYTSIIGIILSLIFSNIIKYKLTTNAIQEPQNSPEFLMLHQINNNLVGIKKLNESFIQSQGENISSILSTIKSNSNSIKEKIDQFADDLADSNSHAIIEAMRDFIEDFNNTFKNFIGQLVDKNFDRLTESISQLINWQEDYKNQIQIIKEAYESLVKKHQQFVDTTGNWVSTLDEIAGRSSDLAKIVDNFKSVLDDDSKFKELIVHISISIENLKQTSEKLKGLAEHLQDTTDAFTVTKEEITSWLDREDGVRDSVITLNDTITQLRQFEISNIEDLDKSFQKRLANTFSNFDSLIKEYIDYLDNRKK